MATPELNQLLALSRDRTAYQNPLFQAVTQMAYQGLPTYARQGTQLSGTLSNQAPPAPSGGMNPALAAGLGGLAGAGLNSLGSNGNALGALINGLKKLFGHGGSPSLTPYGGGGTGDQGPVDWGGQYGSGGIGDQGPWNPNVTTNDFFNWPETSTPFAAFDPSQLPGSGGGMGDQGPQDDWFHP